MPQLPRFSCVRFRVNEIYTEIGGLLSKKPFPARTLGPPARKELEKSTTLADTDNGTSVRLTRISLRIKAVLTPWPTVGRLRFAATQVLHDNKLLEEDASGQKGCHMKSLPTTAALEQAFLYVATQESDGALVRRWDID